MHRSAFRELWDKTKHATVDTFSIVNDTTLVSSVLGEVVGKTFPTEFAPFECRNAAHFFEEISAKIGLKVRKVVPCERNSSLFFETILSGVFGVKDSTILHVRCLREILVANLVERWQKRAFRSELKTLPELRTYCPCDTRILLPNLVDDWLKGAGTVVPMTTLMLELAATAFNIQLGVVSLSSTGDPFLFLYGEKSARRVYIGSNGMSGSQERFFYFGPNSSEFKIMNSTTLSNITL